MGKNTNTVDVVAMALLYRYESTGNTMLSYEKILKYDKVINQNLEAMNTACEVNTMPKTENKLYYESQDDHGEIYVIIDPNINIEEARRWHLGVLPIPLVIAANKPNALETIGLKLVDGKYVNINNKQKSLSLK